MGKHRKRLNILANVLSVIGENNGVKKTQIMYKAYLSYKLLVQYLNEVLVAGLVVSENGTNYKLTVKGRMFLAKFDEYKKACDVISNHLSRIKDQHLLLQKMCPNLVEENQKNKKF